MRHKPSFASMISLVRWVSVPLAGSVALASTGCAPKLGDGCKQGIDCDVRNQRICDRTQPGGYCTIPNCKPGDCGDEGICVRFRPDEPRLSSTFCMAECSSTSDCGRDAYICRSATWLNSNQSGNSDGAEETPDEESDAGSTAIQSRVRVAEVLDGSNNRKFCVAKE